MAVQITQEEGLPEEDEDSHEEDIIDNRTVPIHRRIVAITLKDNMDTIKRKEDIKLDVSAREAVVAERDMVEDQAD